MKNSGEIFKRFRESRGLSLKDVANDNLSKSQLSRFENGQNDLTLNKFIMALSAINVSINEFMYAVNDFHNDELSELLEIIRNCTINNNIQGLKNLLFDYSRRDKNSNKFHELNTILIKIRLQVLSEEKLVLEKDLEKLIDYLFSVEFWGVYELRLFLNSIDILEHNFFVTLSREMIRRSDYYKEIKANRSLINHMTLNAYIICIDRGYLTDAAYFGRQLKSFFFEESEMYERVVYNYAHNYYLYKKFGSDQSIIEMRKCIGFMKAVGSDNIASHYSLHLNRILKKKNKELQKRDKIIGEVIK